MSNYQESFNDIRSTEQLALETNSYLEKKTTLKDIYKTLNDLTEIINNDISNDPDMWNDMDYLKVIYSEFNVYSKEIQNSFRVNDCFKTLLFQVRNLRKSTKLKHIESFGFEFESILYTGIDQFLNDGDHEKIDEYYEYFTDYEHECSIESEDHSCDNSNFVCDYCINENDEYNDNRCESGNLCDHCLNECECRYDHDPECDHKVELITIPLHTIRELEKSFNILHNTFGLEEVNQSMGKHTTVKLRNYQRYTKLMNLELTNQFSNLLRVYGKLYKITRSAYFSRLNHENHFCLPNKDNNNFSDQVRQTHKSGDIRYRHLNFKHGYRKKQIEIRVLPMFSQLQTAIDIEKLMLVSLDWILNNIKTRKQTIVIKSNIPKFRVKDLNKFGQKQKIEKKVIS